MLKITYKKPRGSRALSAYNIYRICKKLLGESPVLDVRARMYSLDDYNKREKDLALMHLFKLEAQRLSSLGWDIINLKSYLHPLLIACENAGFSVDIKQLSSFIVHINFKPENTPTSGLSEQHKAWIEAEVEKLISGENNA